MACTSHIMLENARVLPVLADACVFCSVEGGRVAIIVVVHVDDIFAVGV